MKIITIGFGALLILLGVGSYVGTGMTSLTALIPTFFGVPICILGFMERPEQGQKNYPLFGAVMLAILGFLGSLGGLRNLYPLLRGDEVARPAAVMAQSIMAILAVVFIMLAIMLTKDFWQGWKAFGHFLGNLVARVVLSIFYFTIFVPFAFGVRLFSDPLQIKTTPADFWRPRPTGDQTLEEVMRQY